MSNTYQTSVLLSPDDLRLVAGLMETTGCSRNAVFGEAVRSLADVALQGRRRKKPLERQDDQSTMDG